MYLPNGFIYILTEGARSLLQMMLAHHNPGLFSMHVKLCNATKINDKLTMCSVQSWKRANSATLSIQYILQARKIHFLKAK